MRLAPIAALSLVLSTAALAQDTTILAYHEVDPVPERGWAVSSEDFADQMRFLALADQRCPGDIDFRASVSLIDEKSGRLTANTPPVLQLQQGTGSRHLVVSQDNRFIYLLSELTGTVTTLALDSASGQAASLLALRRQVSRVSDSSVVTM